MPELNARQAELLAAARDDSERLNRIVENLLDLSRIESGRVPLDLKTCSPHSLVLPAVESFLAAYRSAGVGLVSHIAEDVPDVLADTARITHVFSNLLSNALLALAMLIGRFGIMVPVLALALGPILEHYLLVHSTQLF